MAGAAAARYHTNRDWREYESNAARRSAERVAARERRRQADSGPRTGASPGRSSAAPRSAAAVAVAPSARPVARPLARPAERPSLRLVPRTRRRARGMLVPLLLIGFAFLACGGAVPVLLNMAAFHYKAEAVALEKQASSLRAEQAGYDTQAAALGSTARLHEKAEQLGLQHATGVAYIEVPGVGGDVSSENPGEQEADPAADAVAMAGTGTADESRDTSAAASAPGDDGDVAGGRGELTP